MEARASVRTIVMTVSLVFVPLVTLAAQSVQTTVRADEVVRSDRVKKSPGRVPLSEQVRTSKTAAVGDPIAVPDAYFTLEDSTLTISAPGLKENDLDLEGDHFDVHDYFATSNGTLNYVVSDGSFEYAPDMGFTGTDSFSYRLEDAEANFSGYVMVTIKVLPNPNRDPEPLPDAYTVLENTSLVISAPGLETNDYDPDGDFFNVQSYFPPSHGVASVVTDGSFTYTPTLFYTGPDTLLYRLADDNGNQSDFVKVAFTVVPSGDSAPVIARDYYWTQKDSTLTVAAPGLIANDLDPNDDLFSVDLYFPVSHGALNSVVSDGSFEYQPTSGYTGPDGFLYDLEDSDMNSSGFDSVKIEVVDFNRAPIATKDYYSTPGNVVLNIPAPGLQLNDYDPDGDLIFVHDYFDGAINGLLNSVVSDGSFSYDPNGYTGQDLFVYRLQDSKGSFSAYDTVFILVTADIQLPVELTTFTGVADHRDAVLTWETASETNNTGFEVQRRIDGAFVDVAFVEGAGTANEPHRYTYRVPDLEPGGHAFRLKQIDYDGAFEYSAVVDVFVELAGSYYMSQAYPNPFNSRASFTISVARDQHVQIDVMDLLGRSVTSLYGGRLAAKESRKITFDADELPSGLYVIRATGEAFTASRVVTVAK